MTTMTGKPELEALAEDEARLRQRPLGGVDEQERAVGHEQRALDLAAEVGVAGGVDDVDLAAVPSAAAPAHARVLREDRDAALALEIVRVHHALGEDLVRAEGAGLPEHVVDERGLAVVDVGDDGDVADGVRTRGGHWALHLASLAPFRKESACLSTFARGR